MTHIRHTFDEVSVHLKLDTETGNLFWKQRRRGRDPYLPAGTDNGNGYIRITLDGVRYYAQDIVWLLYTGQWPVKGLDHKNRNGKDNRPSNLRDVGRSLNNYNRLPPKNNKTGYTGVHQTPAGKWAAKLGNRYLGTWETAEEAARYRNKAIEHAYNTNQ